MSQVTTLLKEACKLDPLDRAELVSSLLEDLDPSPRWVSDEEALSRLDELKSGKVKGLSEEEFWKACGRS
jgi:hypothetical protein